MIVTPLGSGSSGNSTLIESGPLRVLVDAGFSGRDLERRLRQVDVDPETISGIVITHEHSDHTRGMGVFARRFNTPLYMSDTTRQACSGLLSGAEPLHGYVSGRTFRIGDLEINAFLTAHDAVDPVAVTVRELSSGYKFGVATDLGRPTQAVRHALAGCKLLLLEANHDEVLLRTGPYPWSVKHRIASVHGHLSNRHAAELATELLHPELTGVVLGHLSERCNHRELAAEVVGEAMTNAGYTGFIEVAPQDKPMEPMNLSVPRGSRPDDQLSLF